MEQLVVEKGGTRPDLSAHGSEAQLELYALHRLPESELAPLEEHLLICAACREKLNLAEAFAKGMREATANPETSSRLRSLLHRPAVSMGLGFAVLLIVIGIFSNGRTQIAPSASLQLTATRGGMPTAGPANRFNLKLVDAPREGGPFKIEVLNAAGPILWSGLAAGSPSGIEVAEPQPLSQGDYLVRVYSPEGKMLREYGFRVR